MYIHKLPDVPQGLQKMQKLAMEFLKREDEGYNIDQALEVTWRGHA